MGSALLCAGCPVGIPCMGMGLIPRPVFHVLCLCQDKPCCLKTIENTSSGNTSWYIFVLIRREEYRLHIFSHILPDGWLLYLQGGQGPGLLQANWEVEFRSATCSMSTSATALLYRKNKHSCPCQLAIKGIEKQAWSAFEGERLASELRGEGVIACTS